MGILEIIFIIVLLWFAGLMFAIIDTIRSKFKEKKKFRRKSYSHHQESSIMSFNVSELKKLIGIKCWFEDNILEIRKKSDAEIIAVENEEVVIKHFLGAIHRIAISEIQDIRRKDL